MSPILKFLAAILVVIAVALGVVAYRIANRPAPPPPAPNTPIAASEAPKPAPTYPVVLAAKDIAAGVPMANTALKTAQWPVSPKQAYAEPKELVGKRLRFDLPAGEPITRAMLMQGLATYLDEGQRAVSIPVDEITGASNRIRPGDIVDVFFTLERKSSGGADNAEVADTQARLLLPQVRVLAYGLDSLDGPPPQDAASDNQQPRRRDQANNAMLAVPLARVNELLLAVRSGKLQLALRSPEDESRPDTDLFKPTEPLLAGRKNLTAAERQLLAEAGNRAYAGESLTQVSGADQDNKPEKKAQAPRTSSAQPHRSVQVIRGGKAETVKY